MATNAAPEPPDHAPSAQAGGVAVPAVRPAARKLSEELVHLIAGFRTRRVTLREVIVVLQGRAFNLLMLLLALPFLLPVPIPGLSTILGLVIAIIAARLTLGQKPWLPARLLDKELPAKFFPSLLNGARRVLRLLEVMLRPRLLWLTSPLLMQLHAFIIFLASAVLLLPLPPGTNMPPAICIVIMAGGLLERDGLFVLGGYVAFALNSLFFTYFALYGHKLIQAFLHWISG